MGCSSSAVSYIQIQLDIRKLFLSAPEVPEGFKAQFLPGFVEELVVNDDPEYKWIDKIRTPRASNEARQLLFSKVLVFF